ncbi:ABC transporter substrate-binding protein [Sneathiella chinensis]|uniref:Peptide ABC transporter substrate-binding protein n=1 Tax=Sneathiella chinensis TaxID=349750 RepID=A0ABQ5U1T4_9PROT|nr:ABC transporter substrate-binding protein [Sneathiella chinensis]GLQ05238.1 peptide ABC transporter substrate-binding protein [Sneathiella chinensis]
MIRLLLGISLLIGGGLPAGAAMAQEPASIPFFQQAVADGTLPPMQDRLPETPLVVPLLDGQTIGRYGGELRSLIDRPADVKLMFVYGYARLVGYNTALEIEPDIVEKLDVEEGRIFTFTLRRGHRWSDGAPFTSEDFRYWWEDVANNRKLSPAGPPAALLVDGEMPVVTFPDEVTVRYEWSMPNPNFLPHLAGAAPLVIYRPAHYLKPFHEEYVDLSGMNKVQRIKFKAWASKHNRLDNVYKFDNPDLPTLQPWQNTTSAPANRFVGERNPYFHRVDAEGKQLPYIDRMILSVSEGKLISAKAAAGDSDLQARALNLKDATFLKENEKRSDYKILLWPTVRGSHIALYPNLNASDPMWRDLMRDVRFRRALSLAIDREEINDVLFFGLASEGNNAVQKQSVFYSEDLRTRWSGLDLEKASALLDEIGLTARNKEGIRLLPNGEPLAIIVETAGESTEQTDVLELIRDSWREVGVKLYTKPSQRSVFRNRIFSGETIMSVWSGYENGAPTPRSSPAILAPTSQQSYQWPKWGQFFETKGRSGEAPDMPAAIRLNELYAEWLYAGTDEARSRIWREMLDIHVDQQFSIGLVGGILQPIVVKNHLKNVPEKAIFNWDPGAHFGIYHPDLFWFDTQAE